MERHDAGDADGDDGRAGWRLDQLREEARYRRARLELYRAMMYGGRAHSEYRLREYERASEGASARLRRAEAQLSSTSAERLGDS